MAKPTGFLEYKRQGMPKRPVRERVQDYREIEEPLAAGKVEEQAARCMDCGIPFCHMYGCPLRNVIPEWNDLIYRRQWRQALELLHSTNNFPEFTGRLCPSPCETACTLGVDDSPVTIRQLELHLVEMGWQEGWIRPQPAAVSGGRKIAVVGSGPAGLAAAQQLARAGHQVTVFEAADRVGGILRYGIPDYKLEKRVLDRRFEQLKAEGVSFTTNAGIGTDISLAYLQRSFHAILLAGGARTPRDIAVPGRENRGIHFAMEFLVQQNRRNAGDSLAPENDIAAGGKRVVIIGGGDTGADCLGTALRQGALEVLQLEILPRPPENRDPNTPWPMWPNMLRTSSSHEEGGQRRWSVQTLEFLGRQGVVRGLRCSEVDWQTDPASGRMRAVERAGSEFTIPAELVLLAMGFTKEGNTAVLKSFGVEVTPNGDPVLDGNGMTTVPGLFIAGDLAKGASLVVRAIDNGRKAAADVSRYVEMRAIT